MRIVFLIHFQLSVQGSNGDGGFSATYAYDALDRLVSASQSYGGGGASASCGLTMSCAPAR